MGAEPTLIHSVIRALRLLELIADEGRPVTAKRLSRLADIPLPTTYHLLRTLVHEGYAKRVEGGYVLGDTPLLLARHKQATELPHRVRQVLKELHDDVGAATYVAAFRDGEVELVDIVDSPAAPRVDLWVGLQESAHATAVGKAVIGGLPPGQRIDYLVSHPMFDLTRHTHTTVRSLLVDLDEHPDVMVDREEYSVGTTCLALPVPAPDLHAAVAVSVPSTEVARKAQDLRPLRRAAHLLGLACAGAGADASITM